MWSIIGKSIKYIERILPVAPWIRLDLRSTVLTELHFIEYKWL